MKKTYINPELEVVKLHTMQMLAASINLDITDETISDPSDFDAHEFGDDFSFEDDDEYELE